MASAELIASTFVWTDNAEDYSRAANAFSKTRTVPLMGTPDASRRARWETVLGCYGLNATDAGPVTDAALPDQDSADQDSDAGSVVALHPAWAAPARLFAVARKRRFATYDSVDCYLSAKEHRSGRSGPLLLAGPPSAFSITNIATVAKRTRVPWGLITAADPAGFSFVVAKLLAPGASAPAIWPVIDIVGGRLHRAAADRKAESSIELTPHALAALVCERSWERMAIRAHGEGGHINLESIVLCGLVGPVEHGANGQPNGGCYVDAAGRRCKRAPDNRTRVLAVGDIRATELELLTCTSSLMCGELYASNVSAPLSIAEGYPRSALLADRIVEVHSALAEIVIALRAGGAGLGAVCEALNDMEEYHSGSRPFLVFGDPAGRPIVWQRGAVGATIPTGEDDRLVALQVAGQLPEICALNGLAPGGCIERGEDRLLAWHPAGTAAVPLTLTDGGAALDASEAWLREIARRLASATAIEHAIELYYADRLQSVEKMVGDFTQVREVRVAIEGLLSHAMQLYQSDRSAGMLLPDLNAVRTNLVEEIRIWDRQFAHLMADHLFGGPCYMLPTDGMVVTERGRACICDHCGSTLKLLDMAPTFDIRPRWQRVECDLCGGRASWPDTGRRLAVRPAATLVPGHGVELDIELDLGRTSRPRGVAQGVIVVHGQDKALRVFHRSLQPAVRTSYTLRVTPPADIAPELQTLHVALVEGLLVEVSRYRWPVIPV